jgi:hypothetical protein
MDARDFVELCKVDAQNAMDMFLRNFSFVPEDRLTWSPTPTSKSSLRVAAHTALYFGRFAEMIRNKALPQVTNLEEWLADRSAEEEAVFSREEVVRLCQEGLGQVFEALDQLTDEDVESVLDSGQGFSMSMKFLMKLPAWHATLHLGQIDYLQTCWDDQKVYV